MKKYSMLLGLVLMAMLLSMACNNDNSVLSDSPESLYAIIKPEEAQLIDIIPSDYVLTLNDIIAVNPETGEFKIKNTERIDSKSYPIPVQYVIAFYSNGNFLFSAKLNSSLSSYMPSGLTFCHFLTAGFLYTVLLSLPYRLFTVGGKLSRLNSIILSFI